MSLLGRFEALVNRWPIVSERAGRDLGEYIHTKYAQRFRILASGPRDKVRGRKGCEWVRECVFVFVGVPSFFFAVSLFSFTPFLCDFQTEIAEKELQILEKLLNNQYKEQVESLSLSISLSLYLSISFSWPPSPFITTSHSLLSS